ncbi:unnamed protein product [Aphanomyces euteiches]
MAIATFFRNLNPFKRSRASQTPVKQHDRGDKNKRNDATPPCTPPSSHEYKFVLAQPIVPRVAVPVEIPREYLYQRFNTVGGKKVPFTRRHVRLARRKMIVYERIHENQAYYQATR